MFVRRANCSAAADVGACLAALPPHKVCGACGAQYTAAASVLLRCMTVGDAACSACTRVGGAVRSVWPLPTALRQVIEAIPWDVFPFWSHAQDCQMPAKADHMAALLMSALLARAPASALGMCSAAATFAPGLGLLRVCARAGACVHASVRVVCACVCVL